jgi:hypothetical protein
LAAGDAADPDAAANVIDGFAATSAASGEPVTLFFDVHFHYGSGMTPGGFAYLSGSTAGALVDTAAYTNQPPCARIIDATRLRLLQVYAAYLGVEAA